jgi:hypothetical protein
MEQVSGTDSIWDLSPVDFEIRNVSKKGLGVTTNRTLKRGHQIIRETAPWVYNPAIVDKLDKEARISMQWHGIHLLPQKTRNELLALEKDPTLEDEIDGLMRTNAFSDQYNNENEEDFHWIVFPRLSRFNHDCRPKYVIDIIFGSSLCTKPMTFILQR